MKQSQAAMDLTRGRPLPQILRFSLPLVGTPADIFADARTYILIMFAGIPAAMLYNFASGALRAAGDSRHPFYFLAFSSVLNIFLDWLFIAPFGWGVAGAAWATVLSQFVSGLLDLYWIAGKTDLLRGSAAFQLTFPSYCKKRRGGGRLPASSSLFTTQTLRAALQAQCPRPAGAPAVKCPDHLLLSGQSPPRRRPAPAARGQPRRSL